MAPYRDQTISRSFQGPPYLGPLLKTGQRRLLLGWNHKKDNPAGLSEGKIWCWVGGNKLQVYSSQYNRSDQAGVIVDCGPANFTMIRMFHPYWCPNGRIPRDKKKRDKERCRDLYRAFVMDHRRRGGYPDYDSNADDLDILFDREQRHPNGSGDNSDEPKVKIEIKDEETKRTLTENKTKLPMLSDIEYNNVAAQIFNSSTEEDELEKKYHVICNDDRGSPLFVEESQQVDCENGE